MLRLVVTTKCKAVVMSFPGGVTQGQHHVYHDVSTAANCMLSSFVDGFALLFPYKKHTVSVRADSCSAVVELWVTYFPS